MKKSNDLILWLNGVIQAEITGDGRFLIYNTQTTLKEVDLETFGRHLITLNDKIENIDSILVNGEIEIYNNMLDIVNNSLDKKDSEVLEGILKIIRESL
jgi:hypothetical protein